MGVVPEGWAAYELDSARFIAVLAGIHPRELSTDVEVLRNGSAARALVTAVRQLRDHPGVRPRFCVLDCQDAAGEHPILMYVPPGWP
jgi:hypothetical protein